MAQLVMRFISGFYNLVLGLLTTGKHLGRHAITVQYPKERWTMPERSRGMVVLLTDEESGKLSCTACLLCMRACPSGAIEIETAEDEKGKRIRYPKGFTLSYHICCFCGLCEESCNFAAIKLIPKYEFPEWDSRNLFYDRQKLQEMGRDVKPEEEGRKKGPEERIQADCLADGIPVPEEVKKKLEEQERAKAEARKKAAAQQKSEREAAKAAPDKAPPEKKEPEAEPDEPAEPESTAPKEPEKKEPRPPQDTSAGESSEERSEDESSTTKDSDSKEGLSS